MRLYLSSYGLGNQPHKLLTLVEPGARVGVIANAQDSKDPSARQERLEREFTQLKELGLRPSEVDLRQYFLNPITTDDLKGFDFIWVRGGNVFNLRRAFQQSHFDNVITELLHNNLIVYGGYSAGVCVLSPTLTGIELCDPTDDVPEGYNDKVIWDGLALVPYSIAPHYKSDHYESERIDQVIAYMESHNMDFETLRDGEVIVINGDKIERVQ